MRSCFGKKGVVYAICLMVGMICAVFVLKVQAAESEIPQPSSAKIYSSMSDRSDIIANLIVGNVFEVVDAQNDGDGGIWYRIRTDFGVEGYVKAGELDRLVMDAQAMLPSVPADSENDQNGDEPAPEGDDTGEKPAPDDGDARDGQNAGEESGDDDAGEEPVPGDHDLGNEPEPGDHDLENEPVPGDHDLGNELEPGDDSSGEEPDKVAVADSIDGAGVGKVVDDQLAENNTNTIGNEGFTVIERTDTPKVQRHGRIDAMLIMIMAGGVVCILAIAVLARKIWTCIRTEV